MQDIKLNSDLTTTFISMSLIPLYDTVVTGNCWGFHLAGITIINFDVTFTEMGTNTKKFKISNVPNSIYSTLASGFYGEKAVAASIDSDGEFSLFSNYGPGRYMGYVLFCD
jgi:hypothetical protein